MNSVYLYEDSFINLLSLIKHLLDNKIRPLDIKNEEEYQQDLFSNVIKLKLNGKANIIKELIQNYGQDNFKRIYYVYLTNEPHKELIIYYYLLNYFKYQEKLPYMRKLKCVNKVLELNKKVGNEAHKLKGFLRFRELENGILYGEINPDNNVIEIISWHFQKRLKNYLWVIKDVKRGIYSLYDKHNFYLRREDDIKILPNYSLEEQQMENLWQEFFTTISIKERKNAKCQRNFMPKKYWPYIIEMRDEI